MCQAVGVQRHVFLRQALRLVVEVGEELAFVEAPHLRVLAAALHVPAGEDQDRLDEHVAAGRAAQDPV